MEKSFWEARWRKNEIGFHAAAPNAELQDAFKAIFPDSRPRHALVPLAGKSLDLHWLSSQCDLVTGVEFVPEAVQAFFAEWGVEASATPTSAGPRYQHANIALVAGDFFAVDPTDLRGPDFYYDRAALIALPPAMRADYVAQVARLLPSGARGVIVTIDYDQQLRGGPPFAVTDEVLVSLYGDAFDLERHARRPVNDPPRGLEDAAFTSTWLCQRR